MDKKLAGELAYVNSILNNKKTAWSSVDYYRAKEVAEML
jgi:hypothetical protein